MTRRRQRSHHPYGQPTLPRPESLEIERTTPLNLATPLPPPPVVEEPLAHLEEILPQAPKRENQVANRYEIISELGTGGMGTVYKVRHIELGKIFALKIVHSTMSDSTRVRDMFYAEARMASALEHRNIVSITDFGEDLRRGTFIVMEFLKGESLADRMERHPKLDVKPTCDIIQQTADALQYMHGCGVVHGDIKPENIFLCRGHSEWDRRRNWVKLLDFGLSRLVKTKTGDSSEHLAGTPAYLAPERICGGPPSPKSDMYALGVLFYEMLVGQLPFDGNVAQILNAHVSTPPTPPSFRIKDSNVDERMDNIILKCLSKDPAARFKDVKTFLIELRDLIDKLGIFKRRDPTPVEPGGTLTPGEEACRAMIDANPLPMFAVNAESDITLANKSFCMFVKQPPSRLIGKKFNECRLSSFCPGIVEDIRHVLSFNKITSRELTFGSSGTRKSVVLIWMAPLVVGGLVMGAHGVVHWVRRGTS